jgi:hypothetical protein
MGLITAGGRGGINKPKKNQHSRRQAGVNVLGSGERKKPGSSVYVTRFDVGFLFEQGGQLNNTLRNTEW